LFAIDYDFHRHVFLSLNCAGQHAARDRENWMPSVKAAMGIKERVSRIRSQEQMVFAESPEEVEKYIGRTEAINGLRRD
jgi:hypothetical protein